MKLLSRLLFPLIGYACVATVIAAGMGYGYLRHSGRLDDETLFRITALVHGVELDEIKPSGHAEAPGVPAEEPSFDEQQQHVRTASLNFDAKQKQLADSLVDFDYQFKRLNEATERYASLKTEVQNYLTEQGEVVLEAEMQKVRAQLESLIPKKQAKPLLIKMVEDDRIDEVIALLGSMKKQNQEAILKTFDEPEDLEKLYRIQRKMLAGEPAKPFIDSQLKALEQLKEQEK